MTKLVRFLILIVILAILVLTLFWIWDKKIHPDY